MSSSRLQVVLRKYFLNRPSPLQLGMIRSLPSPTSTAAGYSLRWASTKSSVTVPSYGTAVASSTGQTYPDSSGYSSSTIGHGHHRAPSADSITFHGPSAAAEHGHRVPVRIYHPHAMVRPSNDDPNAEFNRGSEDTTRSWAVPAAR